MLGTEPKPQEKSVLEASGGAADAGGNIGRLRGIFGNRKLRVGLQVLIVLIVLIFFARQLAEQWPSIVAYKDWHFEPLYLLAGLVVLIARGPIICLGWRLIIQRLGYSISWRRAIRIYFYSGMAKYIPGAMWYAVGRVLLAEQAGIPKMVTTVSIALETALVVVSSILVASLSLFAGPQSNALYLIIVLIGLLIFLAYPKPWFALMNKGLVLLGRNPVTINISGRDLLVLLPPFMLNWLAYGVISFCWTAALDPNLTWDQWPAITGLFTLAWVVGFLAFLVPNGWGVRESLLVFFLTSLLGIAAPVALGAAIISRVGSMVGEASWAAIAWRIKPDPARVTSDE